MSTFNPLQDLPPCMMPDGGKACGSYARLSEAYEALKARFDEVIEAPTSNEVARECRLLFKQERDYQFLRAAEAIERLETVVNAAKTLVATLRERGKEKWELEAL